MTNAARRSGTTGHDHLTDELRALALLALDRLDPLLARLRREHPAESGAEPCTACPVCAALAAVRGDRPELAGRLADHATGLVTTLREALAEPRPDPAAPTAPPPPSRPVQHIPVERGPGGVRC